MSNMTLRQNQNGFVAIFSVLIIMGILTLLTIGFSTIVRQAQVRTLNDHLNTQAFYAAESGVNMAAGAIESGLLQKSECRDGGSFDYDIDPANNIAVSCLLINGSPPNLEFSNVPVMGAGEPIVSVLATADSSTVSSIRFEWDSESDADPIGNQPGANFLPLANWGSNVGVLRVDLVPSGLTDRNAVVAGSYSFLLYSNQSGGTTFSTIPGYGGQGAVMVTRCDSTGGYRCRAEVALSGSSSAGYHVRLQAYYNTLRARVAAIDGSGDEVQLQNGQAVVDVTGQANDIYRRIQVRLPLSQSVGFHPPFAIFSGDSICKRYVGIPGGTVVDPPVGVTDPSCQF